MKPWSLATLLSFGVAISVAWAQEKKPGDKPAEKPASPPAEKPATPTTPGTTVKPADTKAAPAGNGMDMQAMMEESKPGKEHDALKPLAGHFTCTTKFYMQSGQPPSESTATIERKWVLGNRYLVEEVKGEWMGTPFEGMGILGYDKPQKMYHAYWVDNFGTGWWMATGTVDAAGKVFTFSGENYNPMYKVKTKSRSTTDISDPNKHTAKMWETGPDGKENLVFEMTCTKK